MDSDNPTSKTSPTKPSLLPFTSNLMELIDLKIGCADKRPQDEPATLHSHHAGSQRAEDGVVLDPDTISHSYAQSLQKQRGFPTEDGPPKKRPRTTARANTGQHANPVAMLPAAPEPHVLTVTSSAKDRTAYQDGPTAPPAARQDDAIRTQMRPLEHLQATSHREDVQSLSPSVVLETEQIRVIAEDMVLEPLDHDGLHPVDAHVFSDEHSEAAFLGTQTPFKSDQRTLSSTFEDAAPTPVVAQDLPTRLPKSVSRITDDELNITLPTRSTCTNNVDIASSAATRDERSPPRGAALDIAQPFNDILPRHGGYDHPATHGSVGTTRSVPPAHVVSFAGSRAARTTTQYGCDLDQPTPVAVADTVAASIPPPFQQTLRQADVSAPVHGFVPVAQPAQETPRDGSRFAQTVVLPASVVDDHDHACAIGAGTSDVQINGLPMLQDDPDRVDETGPRLGPVAQPLRPSSYGVAASSSFITAASNEAKFTPAEVSSKLASHASLPASSPDIASISSNSAVEYVVKLERLIAELYEYDAEKDEMPSCEVEGVDIVSDDDRAADSLRPSPSSPIEVVAREVHLYNRLPDNAPSATTIQTVVVPSNEANSCTVPVYLGSHVISPARASDTASDLDDTAADLTYQAYAFAEHTDNETGESYPSPHETGRPSTIDVQALELAQQTRTLPPAFLARSPSPPESLPTTPPYALFDDHRASTHSSGADSNMSHIRSSTPSTPSSPSPPPPPPPVVAGGHLQARPEQPKTSLLGISDTQLPSELSMGM